MRFGVLWLLLTVPVAACLVRPAAAADPPAISNVLRLDYDLEADGQYTALIHLEQRAGTSTVARGLATFPWRYSPSHEQIDILAAFTRKADGRTLKVDTATIRDTGPDPSLLLFTDRRQKLIPFPDVAVGDSVVLEIREHVTRPLLPGLFSIALLFDPTQAWDDVQIYVTMPGSLKLLADAVGPVGSSVGDGAIVTYAWRYRNTDVLTADPGLLAPIERMPRLVMTTATDWAQIGRLYAGIVTPLEAVTPPVRQTADTVAAGLTDHRAIAERLFDWVRQNIRYVPVPLADTNLVPQAPDAVLANRAGDSQDHAVLLLALLAAKGIASEPVLIDLERLYRFSIPAPFAQLSHVMLYVPEFSAYTDTTMRTARFGELPFVEYGKPVVHAVATGEVVRTTPVLAPGAATMTVTTTARITADDMIVGDSRTEATGPFGVALRLGGLAAEAAGMDVAATRQLRLNGESGTGRFDPPPSDEGDAPDALSGQFAVSAWLHISSDHHLSLPVGLIVLPRPGDLLIGPLAMPNLSATEPTPCFAGRQVETVTLDVGPKYQVAQLPPDRTIANDAFTFTSHWSLQGKVVTVRRELVSRVTEPVCDGKLRSEAAEALRGIRQDYAETIGLAE